MYQNVSDLPLEMFRDWILHLFSIFNLAQLCLSRKPGLNTWIVLYHKPVIFPQTYSFQPLLPPTDSLWQTENLTQLWLYGDADRVPQGEEWEQWWPAQPQLHPTGSIWGQVEFAVAERGKHKEFIV